MSERKFTRRAAVIFFVCTFIIIALYVFKINPAVNMIKFFNPQEKKSLLIHTNTAESDIQSWLWIKEECDNPLILEGKDYFNKMLFSESIKIFERVLADKTIEDTRKVAFAYIGLGDSYLQAYLNSRKAVTVDNNEYLLKAKAYLEDALKLLKRSDILNVSVCSSLGALYFQLGDITNAITYLKRGMAYPSVNCKKEFIEIYTNLGHCYLWVEYYNKAYYYFKKALEICPKDYPVIKHINAGLQKKRLILDRDLRKKIIVHLIIGSILFILIYNFFIVNWIRNKPERTSGYLNKDKPCV